MEKLSGFIRKFSKKHSRKIEALFYPTSTVFIDFFFNFILVKRCGYSWTLVNFQAKSLKNCGFVKKGMLF